MLRDILPIDACNSLFIRPLSYDNDLIYDGYSNTHALKYNGKSLTLAPLSLPESHKIKLKKGSKLNLS